MKEFEFPEIAYVEGRVAFKVFLEVTSFKRSQYPQHRAGTYIIGQQLLFQKSHVRISSAEKLESPQTIRAKRLTDSLLNGGKLMDG